MHIYFSLKNQTVFLVELFIIISIHFLGKEEMSSKQNALLVAIELLFLQQIKANLA